MGPLWGGLAFGTMHRARAGDRKPCVPEGGSGIARGVYPRGATARHAFSDAAMGFPRGWTADTTYTSFRAHGVRGCHRRRAGGRGSRRPFHVSRRARSRSW